MAEKTVLYTKEDGIGIITLNRPEKLNALTNEMMEVELPNAVNEAIVDDEVTAVVLTGSGRAFSAGLDLNAQVLGDSLVDKEGRAERAKGLKQVDLPETTLDSLPWSSFVRIPKPTIAAVNGVAIGGAAEWAAQCDIRIASENARFGWVFSLRGLVPDMAVGTYLLPHIVGLAKALELMYSGEIIDAREAERIGLVTKVVPPDQLMQVAKEMAIKVGRGAPLALKGIKELTYGSFEWPPSIHRGEHMERLLATTQSEDCKEGARSFLEKRPPVWKGR